MRRVPSIYLICGYIRNSRFKGELQYNLISFWAQLATFVVEPRFINKNTFLVSCRSCLISSNTKGSFVFSNSISLYWMDSTMDLYSRKVSWSSRIRIWKGAFIIAVSPYRPRYFWKGCKRMIIFNFGCLVESCEPGKKKKRNTTRNLLEFLISRNEWDTFDEECL